MATVAGPVVVCTCPARHQGTVLEWVGCTSEEFTTALEAALSA